MKRSLIAALAFSSVMSLSGLAMAQTMVGGVEVSAEDLPRVQAQCDALVTQAATEDSQSVTNTETSNDAMASGNESDPASTKADGADGTAAALTTSIDLDTLTLEQCKEAGLVK